MCLSESNCSVCMTKEESRENVYNYKHTFPTEYKRCMCKPLFRSVLFEKKKNVHKAAESTIIRSVKLLINIASAVIN